jgi:hypothetical protein
MKLLFISARDVNQKLHGGFQCTNRNYLSFCKLIGSSNVDVLNLTEGKHSLFRSILKRVYLLFGFYWGLSPEKIRNIIKISKEYDYVFIDSSSFGVIAYYLKRKKYKGQIICFFHNVEYNIQLQRIKISPFSIWFIFLLYYNEKKACKCSDKVVVLNKRDSIELERLYGVTDISIIPISLTDTFTAHIKELTSVPPTLVFIGHNWFTNIQGLKWFVNNVLDNVNIKLQIIGTGMDVLKEKFKHPKIEFLGYVPDLSSILLEADYVISPIFIGGGMKVKTCEALMNGKNIIGTKEAFEGYDLDYQKVGAICNTKEEFVYTIKNYCSIKREKFNEYSRKCFLDKYSFEATLTRFDELISKKDFV